MTIHNRQGPDIRKQRLSVSRDESTTRSMPGSARLSARPGTVNAIENRTRNPWWSQRIRQMCRGLLVQTQDQGPDFERWRLQR